MNDVLSPIMDQLKAALNALIALLPQIILAIGLVILGYFAARISRSLIMRAVQTAARATGSVTNRMGVTLQGPSQTTLKVLGAIVFWTVILLFVAIAANTVGLSMFAGWLDQIVNQLPKIMSGVLIIFVGVVMSSIARDSAFAACSALPQTQGRLVARGAQIATLLILVIVGLDQIGIDLAAVIMVLAILLASVLGGLAVAFGLGARTYVSNLIGARHLGREFAPGVRIRMGDAEGTIAEVTPVAVILDTDTGRQVMPAHLFLEMPTQILERHDDDKR
ncbi:MAG: hypothetical protein R3229_16120 [Alphaproteobacteria bacterium]|nr:hypothetical protein [Alphaproteobacteria bacterium]